jgi:hypothetical protein
MKMIAASSKTPALRARERGMATFIFIVLLAIMVILITSNVRTIMHLRAEERLIEQKQIQRLNPAQTNIVAVAQLPAYAEPK